MFKFISFLLISLSWTLAQVHEISGKTVSANDSSPIAGVNISVDNADEGTASDVNGHFAL